LPEEEKEGMKTQLYLTPRDQGRPVTLEEFENADSLEGFHYELIEGKLEVSPLRNLPHDCVRDWVCKHLRDYAEQHAGIIDEVKAPARVFVPGRRRTTALEPDVAAYSDFPHHLQLAQRRWQDISPVLVADVFSEDTADKDVVRNPGLYLRIPSIREYWILDPRIDADRPGLLVYRRRGNRWQRPIAVAGGDVYTTRLLPEFTLTLAVR
jgi:Uma2 family endonuclease